MIFFLIDSVRSVGTVNTVSVAVIKGSKTSINSGFHKRSSTFCLS